MLTVACGGDRMKEQSHTAGNTYFAEQRRRQWQRVREEYILMLVREGYDAEQIQHAVQQFDVADRQWATDVTAARAELYAYGQAMFREWCQVQGIDYNNLNDEQVAELHQEWM